MLVWDCSDNFLGSFWQKNKMMLDSSSTSWNRCTFVFVLLKMLETKYFESQSLLSLNIFSWSICLLFKVFDKWNMRDVLMTSMFLPTFYCHISSDHVLNTWHFFKILFLMKKYIVLCIMSTFHNWRKTSRRHQKNTSHSQWMGRTNVAK